MRNLASPILVSLAYHIPVLLVLLVGIILALVRYKKHPQVSILACIAFLLLAFTNIISAVTTYLPAMLSMRDIGYSQIALIAGVVNFILTLINLAGWILIIIAIFGWRRDNQAEVQSSVVPE